MRGIEMFCNVKVIPNDIPEFLQYVKANNISIVHDIPIKPEDYSTYYATSVEEMNKTMWLKKYVISFKSKKAYLRFKDEPNVKIARRNGLLYKWSREIHGNDYPIAWWNKRKDPVRLAECI